MHFPWRYLKKAYSPTISTFLMVIGITLLSISLPIYLNSLGYSKIQIALTAGSYYAGMITGCLWSDLLISNIGYIRAFSVFIMIMIISILIAILYHNMFSWVLMRFINGMMIAGLYVVLENWFLSIDNKNNRGIYLSLYTAALGLGATIAPFFININNSGFQSPLIISSLCLAVSSLPFTLQQDKPLLIAKKYKLNLKQFLTVSKIGALGCLFSGFAINSTQTLLPVILVQTNFSTLQISIVLAILIFGNFCFQYPIGYFSDRYDLVKVMYITCIIGIISCCLALFSYTSFNILSFISVFTFGGVIFSLYPLAVNFTCTDIEEEDMMSAIQTLLLLYSIGSMTGPVLVSLVLEVIGGAGLFIINGLILIILTIYVTHNKELRKL